jgi:uncharacterized protein DUF2793
MTDTANLALPLIEAAQAQKHVTHNEALRLIDTLLQLAVLDRDLNAPPSTPSEGQRWIVKASPSPTGAWAGHGNHVAAWQDGGWAFSVPRAGWLAFVVDEGVLIAWSGTAWSPALDVIGGITALQNLTLLGIGTTADSTNPFSAKLNNALWTAKTVAEGGDGNLRCKMSKESAAKTLSLLLQTNFSGRAEVGLAGDDNFHLKVSADGSVWLDAITIDKSTAKLTLGSGVADQPATRAQLAAAPFDALAFNGMQANGNVDVAQELGTTGATLASGTAKYIADCVEAQYVHGAGTAVVTSAQIAAASFPSALPGYAFGHQLKATTALGSPTNGDYALHRWRIEGYRVARLGWGTSGAQPLAYAFQFYAIASGVAFIRFANSAKDRNYYKEITVAAGWNFFSGTIAGDTSGTWDKGNGSGLIVEVYSAGKAASPVAPGAWTATGAVQTTNSTNLLGSNNNLTIVTGLIVLPGIELPSSDRVALIARAFDQELILCQRYWGKTYDYATALGNATRTGAIAGVGCNVANRPFINVYYPAMRADPTLTLYAVDSGTIAKLRNVDAGTDIDYTALSIGQTASAVYPSTTTPATGQYIGAHVIRDARL